MRRYSHLAILILVICGLVAAQGSAEQLTVNRGLLQQLRWVQFHVSHGKIVGTSAHIDRSTSSTAKGKDRIERLSINLTTGLPTLDYSMTSSGGQLAIQVKDADTISIDRTTTEQDVVSKMEFRQLSDAWVTLKIDVTGQPSVERRMPTFWHLMLAEPELCRTWLVPVLELLRPDWELSRSADRIQAVLLRAAASRRVPNRQIWQQWVDELAADSFATREAADRQLRQSGPAIVPFLRNLDRSKLDAEQKFRVRRILAAVALDRGEDNPQSTAAGMVADPRVWLALLNREDESTRRLALDQLEQLLGEKLDFDPTADAATRNAAIERLSPRLDQAEPAPET